MPIRWKTNRKFKPEIVLNKIQSISSVNDKGNVSYSGFIFDELTSTIETMLTFNSKIQHEKKFALISKALSNTIKEETLSKETFIKQLNKIYSDNDAKKDEEYRIITSLSIGKNLPYSRIEIDKCKTILAPILPKKYSERESILQEYREFANPTPNQYTKAIIFVKSKYIDEAFSRAIDHIDLQRAALNLILNPSFEIIIGKIHTPINRIRLGQVHTGHKPNGRLATNTIWYEPNFVLSGSYKVKDKSKLRAQTQHILKNINSSPYKNKIINSLLIFVRALDEFDHSIAFLRLWSSIEALMSSENSNDRIIKRCSFLWEDKQYTTQILEHLRNSRNTNVHSGDINKNYRILCFQLLKFYYALILFHINNSKQFKSIEEANSYLDLPQDINELKRRKVLVNKAIDFLSL